MIIERSRELEAKCCPFCSLLQPSMASIEASSSGLHHAEDGSWAADQCLPHPRPILKLSMLQDVIFQLEQEMFVGYDIRHSQDFTSVLRVSGEWVHIWTRYHHPDGQPTGHMLCEIIGRVKKQWSNHHYPVYTTGSASSSTKPAIDWDP